MIRLFFLLLALMTSQVSAESRWVCLEKPRAATATFGFSVAAAGDTLLIGDPQANSVWGYTYAEKQFSRPRQLKPTSPSAETGFGYAVDIDQDGRIVIGAYQQRVAGVADRTKPGGGFAYLSEIYVSEGVDAPVRRVGGLSALGQTDAYGFSVTRSGDHIAAGLRSISGANYDQGSVLVIDIADSATRRVAAPHPSQSQAFGAAIASDDKTLLIGAPGLGTSGGAMIFDWENQAQQTITAPAGARGVGYSVAVEGAKLALGGEGVVQFARQTNGWMFDETLQQSPGYVARGGTITGVLTSASRQLNSAAPATAPETKVILNMPDKSIAFALDQADSSTLAQWPHRSFALSDRFGVIARPTEGEDCKVAILLF